MALFGRSAHTVMLVQIVGCFVLEADHGGVETVQTLVVHSVNVGAFHYQKLKQDHVASEGGPHEGGSTGLRHLCVDLCAIHKKHDDHGLMVVESGAAEGRRSAVHEWLVCHGWVPLENLLHEHLVVLLDCLEKDLFLCAHSSHFFVLSVLNCRFSRYYFYNNYIF